MNAKTKDSSSRTRTEPCWYASCEDGHVYWAGKDRATEKAAKADAAAHDKSRHGGVETAIVDSCYGPQRVLAGAKDEIIAECALEFDANSDDCNKFLKAVAATFFEPDLFTGPDMNADAIIEELRASTDWTSLDTSHSDAIKHAKDGQFVVAGMTSGELASKHGHLAVVVGDDGQKSGTVTVPICYAGSLNASARVQRKRVSETFPAKQARDSKISYFAREPQTIPKFSAVSRLVDRLRGISQPTAVRMAIGEAKPKSERRTKRKVSK